MPGQLKSLRRSRASRISTLAVSAAAAVAFSGFLPSLAFADDYFRVPDAPDTLVTDTTNLPKPLLNPAVSTVPVGAAGIVAAEPTDRPDPLLGTAVSEENLSVPSTQLAEPSAPPSYEPAPPATQPQVNQPEVPQSAPAAPSIVIQNTPLQAVEAPSASSTPAAPETALAEPAGPQVAENPAPVKARPTKASPKPANVVKADTAALPDTGFVWVIAGSVALIAVLFLMFFSVKNGSRGLRLQRPQQ